MSAGESERTFGRGGAVLPAVLLVVLAMTVLAHGLLSLAGLEHEATRATADVAAARLAAESVVRRWAADSGSSTRSAEPLRVVVEPLSLLVPDTASAGALGVTPGSARAVGHGVRLSRELWLVEGAGEAGPFARANAARIGWSPDPALRVLALGAVVGWSTDSATVVVEGTVTGTQFLQRADVPRPADCDRLLAALDSLAGGPVPDTARAPAAGALLGPLTDALLRSRLGSPLSGRGTPRPTRLGAACDRENPWNWGHIGLFPDPCSGFLAARWGPDGLRVEGGSGQGFLYVAGDVTLSDFEFRGLVFALGRVDLRGGSRVTGMIHAAEGARIGVGAVVNGSACWAAAALSTGVLRRPVLLPESGWIRTP